MNTNNPPFQEDQPEDFSVTSDVSSQIIEINAFPQLLKEQPWSKEVGVIFSGKDAGMTLHVTWPLVQCDGAGLGQIEVFPTLLDLSMQAPMLPDAFSLLLTEQDGHHQSGLLSSDITFTQPISTSLEKMFFMTLAGHSHPLQYPLSIPIKAHLHTFHATLVLTSRNLWWLEKSEDDRQWQDNTILYTNPQTLLDDLGGNLERFIAEAGIIGYQERRQKIPVLLFALGRVAQAMGDYSQAVQFYGKSKQKFQSLQDFASTERVMLILQHLFLRQGRKENAKHMGLQLLNLRASR